MAYTVTVKTTDEVYSYQLRRESEARTEARFEAGFRDTISVTITDDINGIVIDARPGLATTRKTA